MSLRVVLYAEGPGELAGGLSLPRAPGAALLDDELGPAHVLVRRAIEREAGIPTAAVLFEAPLRARGRVVRGSDLVHRPTLRQLLTWFADGPELAVVLVDQDGAADRKRQLEGWLGDRPVPHVVGAAVPEFEAWLLGDPAAVAAVLAQPSPNAPPESLGPRQAKQVLTELMAKGSPEGDAGKCRQARLSLAATCDLAVVAKRCPSFQELLDDLRVRLGGGGRHG